MEKIEVILVVDDGNFEILFVYNLAFIRQHIHCGISNQRLYHNLFL